MLRVGSWLQGKKLNSSASTQSLDSLAEAQNLEAAMRAATLIMNDDVEAAEEGLAKGNSAFHKLGKGVVTFLKATLGFEQDIMREASERLSDAEAHASSDHHKAQRDTNAFHSSIYPPGSEFSLCQAEAQLMGAVVGVLNESLTEAIKAFYKLRKAFITLDGIMEAESRYMKTPSPSGASVSIRNSTDSPNGTRMGANPGGLGARDSQDRTRSHPLSSVEKAQSDSNPELKSKPPQDKDDSDEVYDDDDDDDDDEFHDADDTLEGHQISHTYTGHLEIEESFEEIDSVDGHMRSFSISTKYEFDQTSPATLPPSSAPTKEKKTTMLDYGPDSEVFSNRIDLFIHSGANLCFGLLLLLISLIPPAFGRLLYIIGFRGDRARGIRLLWQASKFNNINGAMAGLILLGYYNGLVGFCDILPDSSCDDGNVEGYPADRLRILLGQMRSRYPKSHLWLLEDARMQGANRHLDRALEMLSGETKSSLKQIEALHMFEKSLTCMYTHRFQLCAESFLKLVDLNNWSQALYYYIAASSHVELYREHKNKSPDTAAIHAEKARQYYHEVPNHTGKKRFMARQLPFDVFVSRKINKWEARAKDWNCDFVDAIGVSPVEEMIFFWNGYKRMPESALHESLERLAWSESDENPQWVREGLDERAILSVLRAAVYRTLRRHEDARSLLKKEILSHDKSAFKGGLKDDWTAPVAHYEMAVNLWMQREGFSHENGVGPPQPGDLHASSTVRDQKKFHEEQKAFVARDAPLVRECKEWIEKAARWDSYDLDARVGLKITTARETVGKWAERWRVAL